MVYLLINICTKNYWNRPTIVEIIVGGWVVSFLRHSALAYIFSRNQEVGSMGVGAGLYMYDVVVKSSRSLSHDLIS